eukprot:TRINITY_DN75_c1_g1_i1.p1 TRINITY_DN75_c1_g1~~TRINITY_DN75_c1_g1_i1.p1  ORF type:complete len:608 (+),score=157.13 TRINITY_DN75_c1_g1_i1:267-1826(+)
MSSFLVTWHRQPRNGEPQETLNVWDVSTGEKIHGWHYPSIISWPPIQWSADEVVTGVLMKRGSVGFYPGRNFTRATQNISVAGLKQFWIGSGREPHHIAIFVPENKKGAIPGSVQIFKFPTLNTPVAKKSFFCDSVTVNFSATGKMILLQVNEDVDKSGKLYYGKSGLYLIHCNGKFDARVTDEQIHAVQWNPNGKEFAVIYGDMPDPSISIFDTKAKKTADLFEDNTPRNHLYYDPTGRILCVGGFASLKGDFDFWRVDSAQVEKIGAGNAFSSAHHQWSPDGRYFFACVLSPRIRVDNGIKIFDYKGFLKEEFTHEELFAVQWRPAPAPAEPRPISPRRGATSEMSAQKSKSAGGAPASTGAYRHPRWSGANTRLNSQKATGGPTRYTAHGIATRGPVGGGRLVGGNPVGGTPVGGGKPKNQRKKNNNKRNNNNNNNNNNRNNSTAQSAAPGTAPKTTPLPNRVRNIEKRIRQIALLKEKQANGTTLNPEQIKKISALSKLEAQVADLKAQIAAQKE